MGLWEDILRHTDKERRVSFPTENVRQNGGKETNKNVKFARPKRKGEGKALKKREGTTSKYI